MTDHTELKRLAEAMKGWDRLTECWPCGENGPDWQVGQVDEDENRYPVMTIDTEQYDAETHAPTLAQFYAAANPAAIRGLIAENERLKGGALTDLSLRTEITEQYNQLKAENAGLQTGYKAYEQVNAELRSEVEALRKALTYIRDSSDDWHACEKAADALIDAAMGQGEPPCKSSN